MRYRFYYLAHLVSIINGAIYITQHYGNVQFNMQYFQSILCDKNTHIVIFSTMLWLAQPKTMSLLTLFVYYAMDGLDYLYQFLMRVKSSWANKLYDFGMSLIEKATGDSSFKNLGYIEKRNTLDPIIQTLSAASQIYLGIFMILELMLPTRSFMTLFMYWNYIKIKTQTDYYMSTVWHSLDQQFLGYVNHRYCPGFIKSLYMGLRELLKKLTSR